MRRTQIYLDEEGDRRLAERAVASGRTKSALIREAIDRFLNGTATDELQALTRFRAAVRNASGAVPRLPAGSDYAREMRAGDRERETMLESHWRRP